MSPEEPVEFPTLRAFGEELARAAERGAGAPRTSRRPHVLVGATAALVAIALFGTLTGPGRALADRLGSIVGIGDDSTLDHASDERLPASGRGVVIATGTVPRGPRYEIVAFANEPSAHDRQFVGGAAVATCLSLDFPAIEDRPDYNTTCFGGDEQADLHTSGSTDYGPDSELGDGVRYTLSGETTDAVASIRVTYRDAGGEQVEAPVAYGIADAAVLDQIGSDYPGGEFVAFIPDDGAPHSATAGPTVLDSVEVTALDADGTIVAADDWGRMISGQREHGGENGRGLLERACAEPKGGQEPRICESAGLPEPEVAPPPGPGGDDAARRLDLLWQQVIARAEAGGLNADVNPARVIRVMRMALSPLGTPLPPLPDSGP
jgi:hypothetical protein